LALTTAHDNGESPPSKMQLLLASVNTRPCITL
jgi:hypothetical protein